MIQTFLENFINSNPDILKMAGLFYIGLLWISIIIWVTRDAINRSNSLLFQVFAIIINLVVPILGILLYLIIRPSELKRDQAYDDLEKQILSGATDNQVNSCPECLTLVDTTYRFCPNCGAKTKQECIKCKKPFSVIWNICPFCGVTQEIKEKKPKR